MASMDQFATTVNRKQAVLVTGGAGYIGSHILVELLGQDRSVVCLDDFSNSSPEAIRRVEQLAGRPVSLVEGDVRDPLALDRAFAAAQASGAAVSAVIHMAGLKAVGDSVTRPLDYYDVNVGGSVQVLRACGRFGVDRFVFSSSASVYGQPATLPITEEMPLAPLSPYGSTKAVVENILRDLCASQPALSVVCLRYFNPIGAHPSGRIGEDPRDAPNNVFPIMLQAASGKRPRLAIFGNDWPTVDGTGVRDYLHVVDLALGHVRALDFAARREGFVALNLGTGRGTSVMQLLRACERAIGRPLPFEVCARRAGDTAETYAAVERAHELLGWRATRSIDDMCADGWRWQEANPDGYTKVGHAAL
jgi:UDP-glucose 4-epimerase